MAERRSSPGAVNATACRVSLRLYAFPLLREGDIAHPLASGVWTHDHPLMAADVEQLGLPKIGVPAEERTPMHLYPQPRGRETSVEYVPGRRLPPGRPPGRERPRRREGAGHALKRAKQGRKLRRNRNERPARMGTYG